MPVKAMDEILQQLVPLLIGSIPTILIFLFLILAYKFLLHGPLLKVLAERRSRTEGAVERAHAAIAAAEAKAQEYEARLRAARAEIFHAREARVKAWNTERESALASARQTARERVHAAKAELKRTGEDSRARDRAWSGWAGRGHPESRPAGGFFRRSWPRVPVESSNPYLADDSLLVTACLGWQGGQAAFAVSETATPQAAPTANAHGQKEDPEEINQFRHARDRPDDRPHVGHQHRNRRADL